MKKSDFDNFVLIILMSYITISNLKSFIYKSNEKSLFVKYNNIENIKQNIFPNYNVSELTTNKKNNLKISNLCMNIKDHNLDKHANDNSTFDILTEKNKNNNEFNFDKAEFVIDNPLNQEDKFRENDEIRSRLTKQQQYSIKNYLIDNSKFLIRCANNQECIIDIPFLGKYGIFEIIDKGTMNYRIQNFIIQFLHKKGINKFLGLTLFDLLNVLNQSYKQYGYNPVIYFAKRIKSCSKKEYMQYVDDLVDKLSG